MVAFKLNQTSMFNVSYANIGIDGIQTAIDSATNYLKQFGEVLVVENETDPLLIVTRGKTSGFVKAKFNRILKGEL